MPHILVCKFWADCARMQLLQRDGYRCIVTGYVDAAHPRHQGPDDVVYILIGCHIIRRAIAVYDSEGDQDVVGHLGDLLEDAVNLFVFPLQ